MKTELLMKLLDSEEKKQRRLIHIPMGRLGEAAEMAKAASIKTCAAAFSRPKRN